MSNFEISVLFFLQLALILTVCRVVGWLAKWVGQPQVVAEMVAGVVMGPSLFGWLLPDLQTWLFPAASKGLLYAVSQVGLVLYMFLVGLEFDINLIRNRLRSAAGVSLSGILAPFGLGCILGYFLVRDASFFSPDVVTWEAMFFVGAAMSITAFPMLARIIYERGLSGTSLGTLALAAGSIDDGAAWCVLALVLASFSGDPMIAILAIGGGVLYAVGTLTVGQKFLQQLGKMAEREKGVWNESGLKNADLDQLIEVGRAETDEAKRKAIYAQAQQIIREEGGTIVPYFRSSFYARRANVQGVIYTPQSILYLHEAWLAAA